MSLGYSLLLVALMPCEITDVTKHAKTLMCRFTHCNAPLQQRNSVSLLPYLQLYPRPHPSEWGWCSLARMERPSKRMGRTSNRALCLQQQRGS